MSARTAADAQNSSDVDGPIGAAKAQYRKGKDTGRQRLDQIVDNINLVVVVGVTLLIAVIVFSEIAGALNVTGPFASTFDNVVNLTGTALDLAPIVLIVIVASVVLSILRRM